MLTTLLISIATVIGAWAVGGMAVAELFFFEVREPHPESAVFDHDRASNSSDNWICGNVSVPIAVTVLV